MTPNPIIVGSNAYKKTKCRKKKHKSISIGPYLFSTLPYDFINRIQGFIQDEFVSPQYNIPHSRLAVTDDLWNKQINKWN